MTVHLRRLYVVELPCGDFYVLVIRPHELCLLFKRIDVCLEVERFVGLGVIGYGFFVYFTIFLTSLDEINLWKLM